MELILALFVKTAFSVSQTKRFSKATLTDVPLFLSPFSHLYLLEIISLRERELTELSVCKAINCKYACILPGASLLVCCTQIRLYMYVATRYVYAGNINFLNL